MSELRTLLWRALLDAGMLIDDTRFDRVRLEAAAASRQHLRRAVHGICGQEPAVVADSLGLSAGAIMRVFGHGWQQAAGFAALAEVRASRAGAISRLGALLSLGIVLFDHVLDTFAERRAVLMEQLTPELFLASPTVTPARCGDTGIDFLVALAVEVVVGAQRLGGRPEDGERFARVLDEMYRGERASLEARRVGGPPSPEVWEALRGKSALPATAVAVLALLGNPAASDAARDVVAAAAALVGEAFWIADDLVDVPSDWDADCWSRPLWLLLKRPGEIPVIGQDAVQRLLESGIAAAEAQRLGQTLAKLAALSGASERTLLRPVQAAVRSWIEELPPACLALKPARPDARPRPPIPSSPRRPRCCCPHRRSTTAR